MLLFVALALTQAALVFHLIAYEPSFSYLHSILLVLLVSIVPMLCVLAAKLHERRIQAITLAAVLLAWLGGSTLFVESVEIWVLIFPIAMLVNSALGSKEATAISLFMSMPLLAELVASDVYQSENLVVLTAILLSGFIFLLSQEKKTPTKSKQLKNITDEQFVALINSMADGVIAIDKDHHVTVYNGAALDILNINVSLEGQIVDNFLKLKNAKGRTAKLGTILKNMHGYFVSRDYSVQHKGEDKTNIFLGITPVSAGYGHKNNGYVILLRDITKEKTLEEERDEFIAVVSHELRTPTAITEGNISNAQMLLERKASKKEIGGALDEAHKQAVFLAGLINDLATLSRSERGVLIVEPEDIDVNQFIKTLAKDYAAEARVKGLYVKAVNNMKVKTLLTSRLYLHEIVQNFVTNSIKYTKSGGVTISVEPSQDGVTFVVVDTGIGISSSDQKRVFEKFFRSEDYRTRESSGTGLGLYVTMKLIKLLGGRIEVESELDKGSTFRVSVPNYKQD